MMPKGYSEAEGYSVEMKASPQGGTTAVSLSKHWCTAISRILSSTPPTGYVFAFLIGLFGIAMTSELILYSWLSELVVQTNILKDGAVIDPSVSTALTRLIYLIPSTFLVVAIMSLVIGFARTRQRSGEMVALKGQIDQMIAGNFSYKRQMRENDELHPLMNKLHELSDILREKSRRPQPSRTNTPMLTLKKKVIGVCTECGRRKRLVQRHGRLGIALCLQCKEASDSQTRLNDASITR